MSRVIPLATRDNLPALPCSLGSVDSGLQTFACRSVSEVLIPRISLSGWVVTRQYISMYQISWWVGGWLVLNSGTDSSTDFQY